MTDNQDAAVANALLDVTAAKTRTADEALRALAFAMAHVCRSMGMPIATAVQRVRDAGQRLPKPLTD